MFGYRYYRDPQGRQVAIAMWVDGQDHLFSGEVIEDGEVIELIEGPQFRLDLVAERRGWRLEKETRTG